MKKINKFSLICSLPFASIAMTTPLMLTGCSATIDEDGIDPYITNGTHVQKIIHTPIHLNQDFTIKVSEADLGWEQIDSDYTFILVDDKPIDYKITAHDTILVEGDYVTSSNIYIEVETKKTVSEMEVKWLKEPPEEYPQPLFYTGQIFKKSDIEVKQLWGNLNDGILKIAEPTGDTTGYTIWKHTVDTESEWVNISSDFKSEGYAITTADLSFKTGKAKPVENMIAITYKSETFTYYQVMYMLCANPVTSLVLDEDDVTYLNIGFNQLHYYAAACNDGALQWSTVVVDKITATGTTMSETGLLKTGTTAGDVQFHFVSTLNPTIKSETYTIHVGE